MSNACLKSERVKLNILLNLPQVKDLDDMVRVKTVESVAWHDRRFSIQIVRLDVKLSVCQAFQIDFTVSIAFDEKAVTNLTSKINKLLLKLSGIYLPEIVQNALLFNIQLLGRLSSISDSKVID
jgi:hypothetical protein